MIYDTGTFYHNTKAYSLVKKQCCKESYKYYLAILNSKVLWFYLQNTGYVLRGGYYTFKTNYLEPFPLPESPSDETVKFLENLVNNIIEWKIEEKDTSSLEKQIDQMVYKLYELTDDEIEIVEEA